MDYEYLIASARKLKSFPAASAQAYDRNREKMAAEVTAVLEKRSDIEKIVGADNLEMMRDNHRNHARFIASILKDFNPEVLVETILWVYRAYRSRGFHVTYWASQLNVWLQILEKNLPPEDYKAIYPLYDWLIVNLPIFSKLSGKQLESRLQEAVPGHG